MFDKDHDALYEPQNMMIWFLLAFQGGLLNVAGFLGVGRFVSHVTGFATLFGVEAAKSNWIVAFGMMLVPLFFLIGTIFSGWFVERRIIKEEAPKYKIVFGVLILSLSSVLGLGIEGFFGPFHETLYTLGSFLYLFSLAFICGTQNAVISSYSNRIVRTTHLTGLTTDLGIGLVRVWTYRKHASRHREMRAIYIIMGIIAFFALGSLIGAIIFSRVGYHGFILPVILTSYIYYRLVFKSSII